MSTRPESPRRVLVTGLSGFTGYYLGHELTRFGWEVHGLADPSGRVDLLDAASVAARVAEVVPHAVVHLAAIAFVAHADPAAMYQTHIVGTRNLLSALAEQVPQVEQVVLASSANVYGDAARKARSLDESVSPMPVNDYAVSKLAMEYMADTWRHGLPLTIVRPFNYTGVGQDERFLIPKIVGHFRRRERRIELGNLDVWRDFSDVRTVAWSYQRLLETRPEGDAIFNVCSGTEHSLRAVLQTMEDMAGYRIDVQIDPDLVRDNEIERLRGDGTRLQRRIGTMPAFDLKETLRWMYEAD